ncbi:MAG: 4-hydroxy-tetrahydrodipicolinate synthase [Bacteroidia bacterium]|jgi:4-hydroxy-tetrahydrodipicolinate synthase
MAARIKGFDFTGVTAVLMASPYYNKPNQNGLLNHYNQMADLCPVPIILYNVPGRTGSMMHADTILELAQHTNIAAVKEASGNFEHVMHLIKHKPENFLIISGDDNYTLPFVAAGMVGVISVIANAYPKDFSQMVRYSLESNFENARYLHYKLLPLMQAIFEDGNPGGIKVILNQIGICENELRLPCAPVSAVLEAKIRALVY